MFRCVCLGRYCDIMMEILKSLGRIEYAMKTKSGCLGKCSRVVVCIAV
jgi:hypothetical protein